MAEREKRAARKANRNIDPDVLDARLIHLREKGCLSFEEIGKRAHMSGSNARCRVILLRPDLSKIKKIKSVKKRKKYEIKNGLRSDPRKLAMIIRMRESKTSLQAIGDACGKGKNGRRVTRERVRQILKLEAPRLLGKRYRCK